MHPRRSAPAARCHTLASPGRGEAAPRRAQTGASGVAAPDAPQAIAAPDQDTAPTAPKYTPASRRRAAAVHVYGRAVFVPNNGAPADVMRVARAHGRGWYELDGARLNGPARNSLVVHVSHCGPVAFAPLVFGVEALRRAARHPATTPKARRALNRWLRSLRAGGVR